MSMPALPSLREKSLTIRDLLVKNKEQIALALPRFMNPDRLIRTALTCFATTPRLLDCTPRSLLGAVIQSAQLGLEPGILGHAYLVPFNNRKTGTVEVQFIAGFKGLLQLARRSGDISTIMAHVVREKDTFKYRYGLEPLLEHVPCEQEASGEVTHIYAVARLKDGGSQFEVMTRAQVEAHRQRYSKAAQDGPWVTAWDEMAKKTVLRRLCKLLPASIDLQTAVALDEAAEVQIPQGLGDLADPPEVLEAGAPSKLDELTNKLKDTPPVVAPADTTLDPAELFPTEAHPIPTAPGIPGVDGPDERESLTALILAEKAKLDRQPSDAIWQKICRATCETETLDMADPAALNDFLILMRGLIAKDKTAITAVAKIVKG